MPKPKMKPTSVIAVTGILILSVVIVAVMLAVSGESVTRFEAASADEAASHTPSGTAVTPEFVVEPGLANELTVGWYMERFEVSEEVATYRYGALGQLSVLLEQMEREIEELDTVYSGVYVEHEPEFKVVFLHTGAGEEVIGPLLEDKYWAKDVEFVEVEWTVADLNEIARQANEILDSAESVQATARVAYSLNVVQVQLIVEEDRDEVMALLEDQDYFYLLEFTCCPPLVILD